MVAETFRRLPAVRRSRHAFAFAARGPAASALLADDLVLPPQQPASPVGRILKHDGWLQAGGLQNVGPVGNATARLLRSRDLIDVVVPRLRSDSFLFLHARGSGCAECDDAWSSISDRRSAPTLRVR